MKQKTKAFRPAKDKIILVGTSAGGMNASIKLLQQLPAEFSAPILLVQHISSDISGNALLNGLNSNTQLTCIHPTEGQTLENGFVYVAMPDHHLLVNKDGRMQVTKGARENRSRPAIDPLFRSAAVAFGNRAIGILLTGFLDDGTAGMIAIERCDGVCIVQDPIDAEYHALKHSGASLIVLEVKKSNAIEICVSDNGKGFDAVTQEDIASGSGLASIKNRLSLYNGNLNIESQVGQGTTVKIRLDLTMNKHYD